MVTSAVNLQVPLYTEYAARANFGTGLTAVVFSAYIVGLIPTLVFLGGISDKLGRKPILLTSLSASFIATLSMALYPNIEMLLAARIFQGIAVGLFMGTCTAYLLELYPSKIGTIPTYIALASTLGFGSGALFTATILFYYPSLAPPSYWIVLTSIGISLVAMAWSTPAISRQGGAAIRPPLFPSGMLPVNLSIALAWTVSGLVIAILPSQLNAYDLELWVGPALFLVNGTGAAVQSYARRMQGLRALRLGFFLIPLGYVTMVLGVGIETVWLVLIGASIAGAACYGFTYLGGLSEVIKASRNEEARVVSGYFLFAYLGFGLPSILLGYIADVLGTLQSLVYFSVVILACSIVLGVSVSKRSRHEVYAQSKEPPA